MNRNRLIDIGKNITLFPKILPGIGLREILLMGIAALQAIAFTFYVETLPLGVRLTFAVLVAIPIMIVAAVPFHGVTFERWLWGQLLGMLEPKLFRHATADPNRTRMSEGGEADLDAMPAPRPVATSSAGALAMDVPNLGVVMAAFFCLLILASALAYATRGVVPLP
jgi:hypothetical protein